MKPNKRLHLTPRQVLGVGHFVTLGYSVRSNQKRFQNKQSLRGAGEPRAVRRACNCTRIVREVFFAARGIDIGKSTKTSKPAH